VCDAAHDFSVVPAMPLINQSTTTQPQRLHQSTLEATSSRTWTSYRRPFAYALLHRQMELSVRTHKRLTSVTSDGEFAYVQFGCGHVIASARATALSWSPVPIVSLLLVATLT